MTFEQMTIRELLDAVASKTPTPGGGAVASVVAALGAALGAMVVNYSIGKKSLAAHDVLHAEAIADLKRLVNRSLELAESDAQAYGRLNDLWKLDKADPKRIAEFPGAVEAAIEAPHALLHASMEMLRLFDRLSGGATNAMLKSDLAIAAVLADAAARAAAWNVRINLPLLEDGAMRDAFATTISSSLDSASTICRAIERSCR